MVTLEAVTKAGFEPRSPDSQASAFTTKQPSLKDITQLCFYICAVEHVNVQVCLESGSWQLSTRSAHTKSEQPIVILLKSKGLLLVRIRTWHCGVH